jgi:hypothetical protein
MRSLSLSGIEGGSIRNPDKTRTDGATLAPRDPPKVGTEPGTNFIRSLRQLERISSASLRSLRLAES